MTRHTQPIKPLAWLAALLLAACFMSACQDDLDRGLVDDMDAASCGELCEMTDVEARIFQAWRDNLANRHQLSPEQLQDRVLLDSIDMRGRQTWTIRFVLLPDPTLREHVIDIADIAWDDPFSDQALRDAVAQIASTHVTQTRRTGEPIKRSDAP